ncbi:MULTISPECIES: preprotein translocase subunit SecG [unclassified Sphingomonas]|uniref:preprotein translocase subunit SecG n=1 Tax=unclassified Sphingomonas TaxID=196159 RepID=UPI0006FC6833|nr:MULTISPECIES: preprotein translocase subunit SecG [unclassified Sphingomonas]KQX20795.1 preprotein translocase subunit SecG [Sphingomonas sp. Root1294]KQY68641.1 preprotein translocase subunit SecG [Sphingomonas sp. Root50]KRB88048.1 preprotein translocase subunit SecG [Sphingomonas sp. Root720]
MLFTFLLVVHIIVAASLVAVILVQRSEGGGLASGGNPGGLMSARGAADFLTRTTAVLAGIFVVLSITLAALASVERAPSKIDTSLVGKTAGADAAPAPAPVSDDPLAAAAAQGGGGIASNGAAPQ